MTDDEREAYYASDWEYRVEKIQRRAADEREWLQRMTADERAAYLAKKREYQREKRESMMADEREAVRAKAREKRLGQEDGEA